MDRSDVSKRHRREYRYLHLPFMRLAGLPCVGSTIREPPFTVSHRTDRSPLSTVRFAGRTD